MQGLHITGDLFDCRCESSLFTDLVVLKWQCLNLARDAGLTSVDECFHAFPEFQGQPGGVTGTVLLAESHLCIHTWPERSGVTLDVYVCNFTGDNSPKAEQLFDSLVKLFNPQRIQINRIDRAAMDPCDLSLD